MPSYPKHAPKHRAATPHRAPQATRKAVLKTSLTLSSMAVVATGVAVGTGSWSLSAISDVAAGATSSHTEAGTQAAAARPASSPSTSATPAEQSETVKAAAGALPRTQASAAPSAASERPQDVTRSDERDATDSLKADSLSLAQGNTLARSESLTDQSPQVIAQALLSQYGWSEDQFSCLDSLWTRESGWNVHADNPSSSAYGIPQALPGSKMASVGSDWADNPVTQIKWGLGYIAERYGSPCGAWGHSQSTGFY